MAERNPSVDAWLSERDAPNVELMALARDLILESDSRVEETIKWDTPTFVYKGNILSFTPSKRGLGLMFHRGAELPGEHPRLEGDGRLVRTMRFEDVQGLEDGRRDIAAALVAWCDWRDGDA